MRTLRAIRFLAAALFALALATPAQMFVLSGMRSVPPGAGLWNTIIKGAGARTFSVSAQIPVSPR